MKYFLANFNFVFHLANAKHFSLSFRLELGFLSEFEEKYSFLNLFLNQAATFEL